MVVTLASFATFPLGFASAMVSYGASACFDGTAGPQDRVSSANGPDFFSNVELFCGDETKGVIHIDKEHPIAEDGSNDENWAACAAFPN